VRTEKFHKEAEVKTEGVEVLLLRPSQVAELLNVSRSKVYELIAAGKMPAVHLDGGRLTRVPYHALRLWVESSSGSGGGASR
jgi:excisionase family DNA binding protein